jgi:hypothetical protein
LRTKVDLLCLQLLLTIGLNLTTYCAVFVAAGPAVKPVLGGLALSQAAFELDSSRAGSQSDLRGCQNDGCDGDNGELHFDRF